MASATVGSRVVWGGTSVAEVEVEVEVEDFEVSGSTNRLDPKWL